jgi:hypothetical protein
MSAWWAQEIRPEKAAEEAGRRASGPVPELLDGTPAAFRAAVQDRIKSFTPDWTNVRADDAGVALTFLLAEMFQPVLQRANRLPEKLLIENLRIAGIVLSPASAARTVLQLQVTNTVPGPVEVPGGFQVATAAASGDGRVIFETERLPPRPGWPKPTSSSAGSAPGRMPAVWPTAPPACGRSATGPSRGPRSGSASTPRCARRRRSRCSSCWPGWRGDRQLSAGAG